MPRTLVIDSVSRACSVALLLGDGAGGTEIIASDYREIGRGHAERLVPMIEALPDRGRAGRIAVNCGPGSFTGVRIGLSAARALAFAWQAELVGYNSLALVAAGALADLPEAQRIAVIMQGGHGECLAGLYGSGGAELTAPRSLPPRALAPFLTESHVAGDAADMLAELTPPGMIRALPDARRFPLLSQDALSPAKAGYARPPDASVPGAAR